MCPSADKWWNELWYIHAREYYNKQERTIDTYKNLDELQGNYVEWSNLKGYVLYGSIYILLKWQIREIEESVLVAKG